MGGGSHSADFYAHRAAAKAASGKSTFDYDYDVKSGTKAFKVHEKLDPNGVTREARDSVDHPDSIAIAVMFDVTGSMLEIPQQLQKKLPQLNSLLVRRGIIKDPQIMFGGIGDATCDKVPFQIGQFESDNRMDEDLERFVLEGGGGGQNTESYELGMYFLARKVVADCWEKRGKKGYAFFIGDERYYDHVNKDEVLRIFGDKIQKNIPIDEIVTELKEHWTPFFIIPRGASHGTADWLLQAWRKVFGGQNVIYLDDPNAVCEAIVGAIGLAEGTIDDVEADLTAAGVDSATAKSAARGLDPMSKAMIKVATGSLPEKSDRSRKVERL